MIWEKMVWGRTGWGERSSNMCREQVGGSWDSGWEQFGGEGDLSWVVEEGIGYRGVSE